MIIKHLHIEKFRAIKDLNFDLGSKITVIVGHNGTMKTTILGILSQTFTLSKDNPMVGEKTKTAFNNVKTKVTGEQPQDQELKDQQPTGEVVNNDQ